MIEFLNKSVLLFENYLPKERCEKFIERFKENNPHVNDNNQPKNRVSIADYDVVKQVKQFLEEMLPIKIGGWDASIGVWLDGVETAPLHVHLQDVRPGHDFTSLIYLNENFDGGEFYTHNLSYKPKTGSLIFFNGMKMLHSVKPPTKNHRYYLIFWWENTVFFGEK
jgi:hypothetical protein